MRRALGVGRYQPLERHVLVAGGGLQQDDAAPGDSPAEPHEGGAEPAIRAGPGHQLRVAGEGPRPQLPFKILECS